MRVLNKERQFATSDTALATDRTRAGGVQMVKPILQIYPMIPAVDEAERAELRPLGRNSERYQEVIDGTLDLVKAADELGFWGVSTIEHHFHSEGYEVGPSPGLLDVHWAAHTTRTRVGQLGYTMSAQNPIRVAEETAILDHLTKGRCFVGFSRGYQARWTNILGQHLGTRATLSPTGKTQEQQAKLSAAELAAELADDKINREIFVEQIDMVLDAWGMESIEHDTARWQIPYPYAHGIEWGMSDATARLGAPGEIGPDGRIRRISVVPAPYTNPHPPVFVASNASLETVEYCGAKGFIPTYFSGIGRAGTWGRTYVEKAAEAGRSYALGQNQALVRWMQIGDTREAALKAVSDYDAEIYVNLYKGLTPVMPLDPADPVQSVLDCGLWMVGTLDEVRAQFVAQWQELPAEFVVLIFHYAQQPKESVIRNMELFIEHIKPALDELTEYAAS
jgi:alkanesulfonate monooxygenase SsuD/methylene tetrahydromethanopterin reductase-like flavin-dependent oxidoreductase (luciferase family)